MSSNTFIVNCSSLPSGDMLLLTFVHNPNTFFTEILYGFGYILYAFSSNRLSISSQYFILCKRGSEEDCSTANREIEETAKVETIKKT